MVYAVHLNAGDAKVVFGRPAEVHLQLLKRNKLLEAFESSPADFIMGRFRRYSDGMTLIDVCSDLWRGKMGVGSPLAKCSDAQQTVFQQCIAGAFAAPVYVIDRGFDYRVPSINEKRFRIFLKAPGADFYPIPSAAVAKGKI